MPHGNAERDASVELFFRRALGHGVHGAHQLVSVCSFPVEQGGRPRRITSEAFQGAVPVLRKVIFGLRQIRQKDLVTAAQSNLIVLGFPHAAAEWYDYLPGPRSILRS